MANILLAAFLNVILVEIFIFWYIFTVWFHKFLPNGPISNYIAFDRVVTCRLLVSKPLAEPMFAYIYDTV